MVTVLKHYLKLDCKDTLMVVRTFLQVEHLGKFRKLAWTDSEKLRR